MCIDTIEALEDLKDKRAELAGEGDPNARGEHVLVVDVGLDPAHEVFNVFRRRHLGGFFVLVIVLPKVFEFIGGLHLGAALGTAEFCDGTIKEVDLIVEVDDVDC